MLRGQSLQPGEGVVRSERAGDPLDRLRGARRVERQTCGSTTAWVRACGRSNVPPSTWQSLWCNPDPAAANAEAASHAPHSSSAGSPVRRPAASRAIASPAIAVVAGLRRGAHIASTACASALNALAVARSGGRVESSSGS